MEPGLHSKKNRMPLIMASRALIASPPARADAPRIVEMKALTGTFY
jgi:hypothetical protein